jgi:trehalose 6-phosphate phosphatase
MSGISAGIKKTAQRIAAPSHRASSAPHPSVTAIRNERKTTLGAEGGESGEHSTAGSTQSAAPGPLAAHSPQYLFHVWKEISQRIHSAKVLALLLDFDGTLVRIQRQPDKVRVPEKTKSLLTQLARHPKVFVAIVSGRRRLDIQMRIGISALHYVGLHGAEEEGRRTEVGKDVQRDLELAKSRARKEIGSMPGMRIEDKGLSFAVHYRGAKPAVARNARSRLLELIAPLRHALNMLTGAMVWEVLPIVIRGKGIASRDLLNQLPAGTAAIYIGDDGTDESAFRELRDQITIRVGKTKESNAQYYVRNPSEVIHFLLRLEREVL